jgi:DNA-binding NarL/FixJ family response regulator
MPHIVLLQSDSAVGMGLHRDVVADSSLDVLAMTQTLAQTRRLLDGGGVDLLVADLKFADGRLIDLLSGLRGRDDDSRPLVLATAMSADDRQLMQALRYGAHGYFIHGSPAATLGLTIHQLLAGESPMSPSIARRLKSYFTGGGVHKTGRAKAGAAPLELTETERQMLTRVSEGYLMDEIAQETHTSVHHVGLRIRSLYRKLQRDLHPDSAVRHAG